MSKIYAGMKSWRAATRWPCRSASDKGHPPVLPGSVDRPSTRTGVV